MLTNLVLGTGLLLASLLPPNVNQLDVITQRTGMCPNGTPIEAIYYKMANDPEDQLVLIVWLRGGKPVAAQDVKEMELYLYGEKKTYPLGEIMEKYESPCDIPHQDM